MFIFFVLMGKKNKDIHSGVCGKNGEVNSEENVDQLWD
jgi:hypothetical protein